jgi:cephalosporin-C deacetylase-like acetyl esterase
MFTRRAFTAALAAAPLLRSSESQTVEQYLLSIAARQWKERASRVAALRSPAQVRERQQFIRRWLTDAIGGFPQKTPLNPTITGTLERDGYRIEKLIYESLPNFPVTANVYVPAGGSGPFPAVLGVAGHSETGKAIATYQHVWISLAKRGFVVLAFDPPGQGERSEYWDPKLRKSTVGIGTREHMMAGLQCLLTGTNFARYEVWDGIRGVDYLLTRSDVDQKRIGVAGNSGGGTQAAYLAVLEPRLTAAVTSCYITSWETLWAGPGPQDSEQVFPNFLRDGLDFGDFLIAFAPKPIQMTTAVRDFFPIKGARETYAEVQRVFDVADAAGRAGYFEYDDEHGWSQPRREACYRWLEKWLHDRDDDGTEAPHVTEPEANLNVTATGQVHDTAGYETVQSLNATLAAELHAKRTALRASPEQLRRIVRQRLSVVDTRGRIRIAGDNRIETEPGFQMPAVFRAGKTPHAVIWIDSATAPEPGEEGVLAIDPRGFGESAPKPGTRGYSHEYSRAMRALLVGKTMLGMQVFDTLRAFEYVRKLPGVDASHVRVAGRGNAGVVAQLAAALEPRIAGVESLGAPESWLAMARTRIHSGIANLVVPGVLRDFDLPDLRALIAPRAFRIE